MKKIFQGFCTKRKRKNIYEHKNADWKQKKWKNYFSDYLLIVCISIKIRMPAKKWKHYFSDLKKKRKNIYEYKYPDWNQKTKKHFKDFDKKKGGKIFCAINQDWQEKKKKLFHQFWKKRRKIFMGIKIRGYTKK